MSAAVSFLEVMLPALGLLSLGFIIVGLMFMVSAFQSDRPRGWQVEHSLLMALLVLAFVVASLISVHARGEVL